MAILTTPYSSLVDQTSLSLGWDSYPPQEKRLQEIRVKI